MKSVKWRRMSAAVLACFLVACNGHAVLVEERTGVAALAGATVEGGAVDGSSGKTLTKVARVRWTSGLPARAAREARRPAPARPAGGAEVPCATNSDPESGFTADSLKLGTIVPLTGALRPLGEQTRPRDEACRGRQGQLDRQAPRPLSVEVGLRTSRCVGREAEARGFYSAQNNTPEEALAGMRRLIDVEKVFLVRDCYLPVEPDGAGDSVSEPEGCAGDLVDFSEWGAALAPWNYSPGINPYVAAGFEVGYLATKLKRQRFAVLADPSVKDTLVKVVRRVAADFKRPIHRRVHGLQEGAGGIERHALEINAHPHLLGRGPDA